VPYTFGFEKEADEHLLFTWIQQSGNKEKQSVAWVDKCGTIAGWNLMEWEELELW